MWLGAPYLDAKVKVKLGRLMVEDPKQSPLRLKLKSGLLAIRGFGSFPHEHQTFDSNKVYSLLEKCHKISKHWSNFLPRNGYIRGDSRRSHLKISSGNTGFINISATCRHIVTIPKCGLVWVKNLTVLWIVQSLLRCQYWQNLSNLTHPGRVCV